MKKSRVLWIATAFLTVCVMLVTGCSTDKSAVKLDSSNPVSLEVWHYYNGPQKIAFDDMVSEFNETIGQEKGIVVEAFNQGSVSDLLTKVSDAANKKVGADDIPDIFAAYADTAYELDQLGVVADLDPYFTQEELEQYVPSYIEEGRFDQSNSLKIFPTAKSTEVMMLNKTDWDKFAEATGATYEDISTIEGITETARKYYEWTDSLTPEADDGKTFFGRDVMANYLISGMKQQGITLFDVSSDGKVTFNLDEKALRKLWDNYYVPYINGYFGAFGKFRSDDAKTGDLIALVCSTTGATYFPSEVTINDTESYPIEGVVLENPCFEGAERYSIQQGAGMVVTKSDEKTEYAAAEFLKWFTDTQRNIDFSVTSGYLPVKNEANDTALVEKSFENSAEISTSLEESVLVSIGQVQNDQLYTNKAFKNGFDARNILEYSLSDKAAADRESVLTAMAEGTSRSEAVAVYDNDENFSAWVADLKKQLEETQK
ncbi:extracellular solute-binding protein [Christensenella hongkongensis]|uniref:Glycerol-3-phosphate ABC transporter, periplasmic glycerol-3-phosphate-binding protein n=1 Tax=Christensenella hongkongensis TaxID=270498 RepID=A0A0M2NHQ6_9FIRM|nr:extracellular solute-binding protein [Christensenella hongkongensis]KKI49967.1 Glycerol-3-phosphate ABC transporter, periplasmic glycerol-3-phosphate-binding protein [Christensenella hongkongensis]TCW27911.1 carbohydrate ABC transporter substrate-binding protein (CUT1 family) [Christensenella hongkongensis]